MDVVLQCVGFQDEGCFPVEVVREAASDKAEGNRAICCSHCPLWQTMEWGITQAVPQGGRVEQGIVF